jgi:hypothetical protein
MPRKKRTHTPSTEVVVVSAVRRGANPVEIKFAAGKFSYQGPGDFFDADSVVIYKPGGPQTQVSFPVRRVKFEVSDTGGNIRLQALHPLVESNSDFLEPRMTLPFRRTPNRASWVFGGSTPFDWFNSPLWEMEVVTAPAHVDDTFYALLGREFVSQTTAVRYTTKLRIQSDGRAFLVEYVFAPPRPGSKRSGSPLIGFELGKGTSYALFCNDATPGRRLWRLRAEADHNEVAAYWNRAASAFIVAAKCKFRYARELSFMPQLATEDGRKRWFVDFAIWEIGDGRGRWSRLESEVPPEIPGKHLLLSCVLPQGGNTANATFTFAIQTDLSDQAAEPIEATFFPEAAPFAVENLQDIEQNHHFAFKGEIKCSKSLLCLGGMELVVAPDLRRGFSARAAVSLQGKSPGLSDFIVQAGTNIPISAVKPLGNLQESADGTLVLHNGQGFEAGMLLSVRESVALEKDQTLKLALERDPAVLVTKEPDPTPALVIAPEPFFVAVTEFALKHNTRNTYAVWNTGDLESHDWQISFPTRDFKLWLPPQAVEEAVHRRAADADPNAIEPGQPVKARFASSLVTALNRSDAEQGFSAPPWSLRDYLGYAGQRNPGSRLVWLKYEIIRGLLADFAPQYARLSELGARLGFPRNPELWKLGADGNPYEKAWQRLYELNLSRLGVLELRDERRAEPAVFDERDGLRITIGGFKSGEKITEFEFSRAIESDNILNRLDLDRQSVSAVLDSPMYSAFGAWGKSTGRFDRGLTEISVTLSMGRLERLIVTRLGRICVWGNAAKLVTIYERRIGPTAQFAEQQHELPGRAIIRKSQEYIELLETEKDFVLASDPRRAGCVVGGSFANGGKGKVQIPVDSLWGQDVSQNSDPGLRGWILPLWNPAANPEIYPLPAAALKLAADTGVEARQLANPEALIFFTETGGTFSGDPSRWPWVPGLDGPMENSADAIENEKPVDDKLARFTFVFLGEPPKANVVSGRSANSLMARLVNVSLARTLAPERPASPATQRARATDPSGVAASLQASVWAERQLLKIDPAKAGAIWQKVDGGLSTLASTIDNKPPEVAASEARVCARAEFTDGSAYYASTTAGLLREITQRKAQGQPTQSIEETAIAEFLRKVPSYTKFETKRTAALRDIRQSLVKAAASLRPSYAAALENPTDPSVIESIWSNVGAALRTHLRLVDGYIGACVADWVGPHRDRIRYDEYVDNNARTSWKQAAENFRRVAGVPPTPPEWPADRFDQADPPDLVSLIQIRESQFQALSTIVADRLAAFSPPRNIARFSLDSESLPRKWITSALAGSPPSAQEIQQELQAPTTFNGLYSWVEETNPVLQNSLVWTGTFDLRRLLDWPGPNPPASVLDEALRRLWEYLSGLVPKPAWTIGRPEINRPITLLRGFGVPPVLAGLSAPAFPSIQFGFWNWVEKAPWPKVQVNFESLLQEFSFPGLGNSLHLTPSIGELGDFLRLNLENVSIESVFKDLAGLKIGWLLDGAKFPTGSFDAQPIRITHGIDAHRSAWIQAECDMKLDSREIFGIITLHDPTLRVRTRVQAPQKGSFSRTLEGEFAADWELKGLITLRNLRIVFDSTGKTEFHIDARSIELNAALRVVSETLNLFPGNHSGVKISFTPAGIRCSVAMACPTLSSPACAISNLNLGAFFEATFAPDLGFSMGANVAGASAPFTITFGILGGAGFLDATAKIVKGSKAVQAYTMGIFACACFGLRLGPIGGSVGVYFGAVWSSGSTPADSYQKVQIMIIGQVTVFGWIHVELAIILAAVRQNGVLKGVGTVSITIRLGWFFKFTFHRSFEKKFGGNGSPTLAYGARSLNASPLETAKAYAHMFY